MQTPPNYSFLDEKIKPKNCPKSPFFQSEKYYFILRTNNMPALGYSDWYFLTLPPPK